MIDIPQTVRNCQDGHLDAYAILFSHYQNRIYDLACIIVRDETAAKDVVQDTFLVLFEKIGSRKGDSVFETSLTSVAVANNDLEMARLLIANGADVDYGEKRYDVSPLLWAANENYADMVAWLLENGADPNLADSSLGNYPLALAAKYSELEIAKILLDASAGPTARSPQAAPPMRAKT